MKNKHYDERITFITPSYLLEYDFHWSDKIKTRSSSANLKVTEKGQESNGVGYQFTSTVENTHVENIFIIKRPAGTKHDGESILVNLSIFPDHIFAWLEVGYLETDKNIFGKVRFFTFIYTNPKEAQKENSLLFYMLYELEG
jgi:hypothetical protein